MERLRWRMPACAGKRESRGCRAGMDALGGSIGERPAVEGDPARVLEGLVRKVAEAQVGNRNACLNWAAYRAGEHVARGELEADDVHAELRHAAVSIGLPEREIENTIASGLA